MKRKINVLIFLLASYMIGYSQPADKGMLPLIPYPQDIEYSDGKFGLSHKTVLIATDNDLFGNEIIYTQNLFRSFFGKELKQVSESKRNYIKLIYTGDMTNEEGYELDITSSEISLKARTPEGMFNCIQTLKQLLLIEQGEGKMTNGTIDLPCISISDSPAFSWRGSHIDVSRHFFGIDYLKKHIDRLALYKMNKLHLHLTDDQGWRIEIKKYPQLTDKGAFRSFNNHDSICMELAKDNPDFEIDSRYIKEIDGKKVYGGYYTQQELRDLVAYASARHIEIIPEIDMPGHMMAAISVFPELVDGKIGWGELFSTPLCPCKEEVYTFLENVIDEVASIFPSQYIHIGADEVDKTSWQNSELCKSLMAKENIVDFNALQSYFVHRIQAVVQSRGKKIIAWDEALDGGIDSNVAIMYWRGWVKDSPRKAAANGNPVIMSPTNPLYFDTFPDKSSLRNVYNMQVVYDDIPESRKHLIKGAQANLWAERIPSENRADFLLFPRITALAERLWTNKDLFEKYSERLLSHYSLFDKMDIAYRMPDLCGFAFENVYVGESSLNVQNPLPRTSIHYTVDGSIPSKDSPVLATSLVINTPVAIKLALFGNNRAKGDVYNINYKESSYAKPQFKSNLAPGLVCKFYNQPIDKVAKISGAQDEQFVVDNITVPATIKAPQFGLTFDGFIEVPQTGIYSFYLTCDDAGMLYIADRLVVDNEGPHSPIEKSGQVALEKGTHPFKLDFVEGGGGYTLILQYSSGGCDVKDIPDNWFKH